LVGFLLLGLLFGWLVALLVQEFKWHRYEMTGLTLKNIWDDCGSEEFNGFKNFSQTNKKLSLIKRFGNVFKYI